MHKFEWRITARIVAYLDMILCILALGILLVVSVAGVEITYGSGTNRVKIMEEALATSDQITAFVIGLCVAMATCVFVEIWAAAMLLKATKRNAEYTLAFRRARTWRRISLLYLVAGILFNAANRYYLCMIIESTFRLFIIFVVHKFMGELDAAIGNGDITVTASQKV